MIRLAPIQRAALAAASLTLAAGALAAPGAHGPDGEHLDQAAAPLAAPHPRLEASTEAFELVAELRAGELVILIDRWESNEPVLDARLGVQSGSHEAQAEFRAERGDYVVRDPAFLAALGAGEHPLVFALAAGAEADLLDAVLVVPAAARAHDHDHRLELAAGAGAGVLALAGAVLLWRRRAAGGGR